MYKCSENKDSKSKRNIRELFGVSGMIDVGIGCHVPFSLGQCLFRALTLLLEEKNLSADCRREETLTTVSICDRKQGRGGIVCRENIPTGSYLSMLSGIEVRGRVKV